ncbi:MAG TPA: hypothetical protein VG095_04995 [Chthoniobacterales bacterium]|nr:hypothetical protein [Chthoniobacterales bacterium]
MNYNVGLSLLTLAVTTLGASASADIRGRATAVISEIQRADYEGDRVTLQKSVDALAPFVDHENFGSRIHYWRGFALWRSAINGFNDAFETQEPERDLRSAVEEFKAALRKDEGFVDAKVGLISSLGYLVYMKRDDAAARQELLGQIFPLVEEAKAAAPNNPRLRWVMGPILWHQARQSKSGLGKLIENYKEGLAHCSAAEPQPGSLEPTWGKPELLMSLAYTYLNDTPPDVEAAEKSARSALELVPYWRYTRDILLPQITAAKANAK